VPARSIIAAPGLADRLASGWRVLVGSLAMTGLLALLYGTWQAMRGAFGLPGAATAMTGERLRRWESEQAQTGVTALQRARAATLAGITLLIATAGAAFLAAPSTSGQMVQVDTGGTAYCGKLGKGKADGSITVTSRDGTIHTIPTGAIKSIDTGATC
jgi:hypothetical protein